MFELMIFEIDMTDMRECKGFSESYKYTDTYCDHWEWWSAIKKIERL